MQAIAIFQVSKRNQGMVLRWTVATGVGYLLWAIAAKVIVVSGVIDGDTPAVALFVTLMIATIIPGLLVGFAQYCSLKPMPSSALGWPLINVVGLLFAMGAPVLPIAFMAHLINAANPDSPSGVIVFLMFLGFPAWLILSIPCGCFAVTFTGRWLLSNVFQSALYSNKTQIRRSA